MASAQSLRTAIQPLRHSKFTSPSSFSSSQLCYSCQHQNYRRIQPFSSSRYSRFPAGLEERQRRQFIQNNPNSHNSRGSQPGTRSRLQHIDPSELPDDFGIAPETFIKPTATSVAEAKGVKKKTPSWLGETRKRLDLEWYWIKNRVKGFASTVVFCKWSGRALKTKLAFTARRRIARDLHKALYTAVAEGNIPLLRSITGSSLQTSLLTQIAQRPASTTAQKWSLFSYTGIPMPAFLPWPLPAVVPYTSIRVVSDRCFVLPLGRNSGLRQMVVRISSKQRLENAQSGAALKEWSGTEYLVLQKLRYGGREHALDNGFDGWKVWGTTEEADWDEYLAKVQKLAQGDVKEGFMERVRGYLPSDV